ncbi:acyl carrier protein [Azospirillum thermophilum]|uniref:acyl carrier protein n=1 Tax=Azospirillum thermophilum TaxID=2202148 RepID=UPI001FEB077C|nr:acyl carrier protein [Azospirillum thermophilum]
MEESMAETVMLSRDEIYEKLKGYLEDMFEVPPERVSLEARLFDDLDLDSIDAVDLVVKLQELTGRKFKPEEFKSVRTVGDILDRVHALLAV